MFPCAPEAFGLCFLKQLFSLKEKGKNILERGAEVEDARAG